MAAVDVTREPIEGNRLTSGESTMRRLEVNSAGITQTSGIIRFGYFTARKTETTTQVRVLAGTTAAGATPTLVRVGIYTEAQNGDLTLVASTANDTSLLAAASTAYTKALSASLAKVAGVRYALGLLVVTGAAAPTTCGNNTTAGIATEAAVAPRLAAFVGSQADLPSTVAAGSLSNSSAMVYGVLLP